MYAAIFLKWTLALSHCLVCSLKKPHTADDIYSLGVLLYEIATQELPYNCNEQLVQQAVKDGTRWHCQHSQTHLRCYSCRPDLDDLPKDTPGDWKELMEQCWAQERQHRPTAHIVLQTVRLDRSATMAAAMSTQLSVLSQVSSTHCQCILIHAFM